MPSALCEENCGYGEADGFTVGVMLTCTVPRAGTCASGASLQIVHRREFCAVGTVKTVGARPTPTAAATPTVTAQRRRNGRRRSYADGGRRHTSTPTGSTLRPRANAVGTVCVSCCVCNCLILFIYSLRVASLQKTMSWYCKKCRFLCSTITESRLCRLLTYYLLF